jgi:DNA-binding NtrC family response regulator
VPLHVPPLRERPEDVLPLARLFVDRFAKAFKKPFRGLAPSAEQVLTHYAWPGNIRELKNLMERTVLLENGEWIEAVAPQAVRAHALGAGGHARSACGRVRSPASSPRPASRSSHSSRNSSEP